MAVSSRYLRHCMDLDALGSRADPVLEGAREELGRWDDVEFCEDPWREFPRCGDPRWEDQWPDLE